MPGTFSIDNPPKLPGAYVNFIGALAPNVPPSIGSIVAVPFTHDWGPFNQAVLVGSFAQFQSVYGTTPNTPGYVAVKQAFMGESTPGRGGAGAVLCYRFGGAAAAKATKTLQNTAGTPASAITLTAKYQGAKGNQISITTQDHAADPTKNELLVLLGTTLIESYVYADTDIADLTNQINTYSHWLTATMLVTGTALGGVTATPLTGGADGGTLVAGDWTAMMSGLEPQRFGILAPFDLTDSAILASLKTWALGLNSSGKRFMTVVGGAANETLVTAKARAVSLNDGNFMTIGMGSISDSGLPDAGGNPTILSTSQFVPRLAGALAGRGESLGMTYARFAGVDLVNGPSVQNISDAYDSGIITLSKDASAFPVRVAMATTTYVTQTDPNKPVTIFREPKFMRTMQTFEMEITEYAEQNVVGLLPINDKTRLQMVGEMKQRLKKRADANVIQSDYSVAISQNPPPNDSQDFIALDYGILFGRSLNKLLNTIRVG